MFKKKEKKEQKSGSFTLKRGIYSILIIGFIGFFFVIWMTYLYPMVENMLPVWLLFLIFYVLIITFWSTFFIGLFGAKRKSFKNIIIFSAIFAMFDLYCSISTINLDGSLSNDGYKGSVDYFLGYYLGQFGYPYFLMFITVYLLIPILVFIVLLLILKPRRFKESITQVA
jgi:hypothetical protein